MTDGHPTPPSVLMVASERWPSTAMLADTLHRSGFAVAAVDAVPYQSPLYVSYQRMPWHDRRLVAHLIADALNQRKCEPGFLMRLARRIILGKAE